MDPNTVPDNPIIPQPNQPVFPTQPPTPKSNNNLVLILGIIILMIVLSSGGYFIGKVSTPKGVALPAQTQLNYKVPKNNPIFTNQTAIIIGEITRISGSILSIKSKSGQRGDFPISSKIVIYREASASSDLNKLETGKSASIGLALENNQYKVSYVYFNPPPQSSPSAFPN